MIMGASAIAGAYWRKVKKGGRTFESVPNPMKDYVIYLAKTDATNGVITDKDY